MRGDGAQKGWQYMIRQVEFLSGFLYDFGKGGIMYVADLRKQVVLDLIIQATDKPGSDHAVGAKISGIAHLMFRPAMFHFRFIGRLGEGRRFHHMRRLKDTGEGQSADALQQDKTQSYVVPGKAGEKNRDHNDVTEIKDLQQRQTKQGLAQRGFLLAQKPQFVVAKQHQVIFGRHPVKVHDGIQKPGIKVLKLMNAFAGRLRRHTQKAARFYIFIQPGEVGIGMMQDVVLNLPVQRKGADHIDTRTHKAVYEFAARKSAVVGIVHYGYANTDQPQAHHRPKKVKEEKRARRGAGCDKDKRHHIQQNHYRALDVHLQVAMRSLVLGFEILIGSCLDGIVKAGCAFRSEFYIGLLVPGCCS